MPSIPQAFRAPVQLTSCCSQHVQPTGAHLLPPWGTKARSSSPGSNSSHHPNLIRKPRHAWSKTKPFCPSLHTAFYIPACTSRHQQQPHLLVGHKHIRMFPFLVAFASPFQSTFPCVLTLLIYSLKVLERRLCNTGHFYSSLSYPTVGSCENKNLDM